MNRISPGLKISQALQGFLQAKAAQAISQRTLDSYEYLLNQWLAYAGDMDVSKVAAADLRAYLAYLRTEYVPKRFNGKTTPLSPKSR
ncbi:MAG: site-specific integrase [Anaerolineales bacterium]|nr:site-specific integrase [Anaerolineales bacterium]